MIDTTPFSPQETKRGDEEEEETEDEIDDDDAAPDPSPIDVTGDSDDNKDNIHCHIQFTTRDKYELMGEVDDERVWARAQLHDPAPEPQGTGNYKPGDYALVQGNKLELKKGKATIFDKVNQWVLQEDWTPFEDDMTSTDLYDLGDQKFLIWFQMIKPPTTPIKKIPRKPTGKPKRGKR
jgi:hypothetical protein